ncbi:hypothetical protein [Mesorhizobium sp. M0437]
MSTNPYTSGRHAPAKPRLIGSVKHLRGEHKYIRHASLLGDDES